MPSDKFEWEFRIPTFRVPRSKFEDVMARLDESWGATFRKVNVDVGATHPGTIRDNILGALSKVKPRTSKQIAESLGFTTKQVYNHIYHLRNLGLIKQRGDGYVLK